MFASDFWLFGINSGQFYKLHMELAKMNADQERWAVQVANNDGKTRLRPCPCCGGRMIVIEVFARGSMPKYRPPGAAPVWADTS